MSVVIKYNNVDVFSQNNIPTPFLERGASAIGAGFKKGFGETFLLNGHISSGENNCDDFNQIRNKQKKILEGFSESFKSLVIEEDGVEILKKDFVIIDSIDFSESSYIGVLNFSISLNCIDEKNYNENYGIIDPEISNSISIKRDGIKELTRRVSAKGLNNQDGNLSGSHTTILNSGFENAINFVKRHIEVENSTIFAGEKYYLSEELESFNRTKLEYSVERIYVCDSLNSQEDNGILRYSIQESEPAAQVYSINISGELFFGINEDFSKTRSRYQDINFLEIAKKYSEKNLVDFPLSSSIVENVENNSISFDITFDNDTTFSACGVSNKVSYNFSNSGNQTEVSVEGEVSARGPQEKRFPLVKNEFYNQIVNEIRNKAQEELDKFSPAPTPTPFSGKCGNDFFIPKVNESPESYSVVENRKKGIITYSYIFKTSSSPDKLSNFQANVEIEMPVKRYMINYNAGGGMNKFIISSSGEKKATVSVSCSAVYENSINENQAKDLINNYILDYLDQVDCIQNFGEKYLITENVREKNTQENFLNIRYRKKYYDDIV